MNRSILVIVALCLFAIVAPEIVRGNTWIEPEYMDGALIENGQFTSESVSVATVNPKPVKSAAKSGKGGKKGLVPAIIDATVAAPTATTAPDSGDVVIPPKKKSNRKNKKKSTMAGESSQSACQQTCAASFATCQKDCVGVTRKVCKAVCTTENSECNEHCATGIVV